MSETRWKRAILHLDMDAFFVNVHLLDHPEDRGVPLAIGGKPDQRGVVASASYEARAFGIRSAMPMARAVRLCPTLKIARHNWSRIRESSQQVMGILGEYGPLEKMSVDEAYVDISAHEDVEALVERIRQQVKRETNLPASVGLATSKLVAKVASDYDKPEGCTVVPPGEEAAFLGPMSVRALWGIGPRTAERLAALKVTTCGELAMVEETVLAREFGRHGVALRQRAIGHDPRPISTERGPVKSISSEWTFNHDISSPSILKGQLRRLCREVGRSVRQQELQAHTVFVKFRWDDFTTFTRQRTMAVPIRTDRDITRVAIAIWRESWSEGQAMRLIGMGVSKLVPYTVSQLSLDL